MSKQNTVNFDVEGLGTFVAWVEPPAKQLFIDRRAELARLLGGRVQLVAIESEIRRLRRSDRPEDQEVVAGLLSELANMDLLIDLKAAIKQCPEGVYLDRLDYGDFMKISLALESARQPFRPADIKPADAAPEPVKDSGQPG
jgi:sigma54-dependent transcription regulator